MRSPYWFVVAGLVAVAGFVGAGLYAMPRFASVDAMMMRIVTPGSAVLTLDRPGLYTIYHEKKAVVDGQYYASDAASGLRVGIASEATGAPVQVVEPSVSSNYSFGNRSGTSIFAFTIDQPGRYRLTAGLAGGRTEPKVVLAVEQGMLGAMFGLIFGAIAIAFAGVGVAGAIVCVTLWQRSRARKPAQSIEPGVPGG